MNVLFSGNDAHTIDNQTGSSGWRFIVTDVHAPNNYYAYTGNIQITNNTINIGNVYCYNHSSLPRRWLGKTVQPTP